mgnify:CR=1 FL=1
MIPAEVVFMGPAALTVALLCGPGLTHQILRLILPHVHGQVSPSDYLHDHEELKPKDGAEKRYCEEEVVINMYNAIFCLIVSLIILFISSYVYNALTQGWIRLASWVVAGISILIGVFVVLFLERWINPEDFRKTKGKKIARGYRLQLKNPLNQIRFIVLPILSWGLACIVYFLG